MTRQTKIATIGVGINSDLQPDSIGSVNQFYITDTDVAAVNANTTSALNAANTANTNATSALNAANTANTNATAALAGITTETNNRMASDAYFNGLLAGSTNYFYGEYVPTGTPSGLVIPAFTNVSSEGISYGANGFNFSYLGKYLILGEMSGDMVNSRSNDWYQEPRLTIQNGALSNTSSYVCGKSVPPQGTWTIASVGSNIIKVSSGDTWKCMFSVTALGVLNANAKIKVHVYKVG